MDNRVVILNGAADMAAASTSGDRADEAMRNARSGQSLYQQGQLTAARQNFLVAIDLQPDNPGYRCQLALCDWDLGLADSAGEQLQIALHLDPKCAPALVLQGQWYLINGMVDLAMKVSARTLELDPDNLQFLEMRARVLEAAGDLDQAWDMIQQLIARRHLSIAVAKLYGRMARSRGRQEHALAMLLSKRTSSSDALPDDLDFIVADLLDGMGRYDEAFAHVDRANKMRNIQYDPDSFKRGVDRFIEYFTKSRLDCLPKANYRQNRPVFIVGMPRSGTSLLEQILASHPSVYGAGELDFMFRVASGVLSMLSAQKDEFPECLNDLSIQTADGLAQIYLEPLNLLSATASRVIDKMPYNFINLGLISILLPGSRVIHCRRDPMDTCLSCYMTPFSQGGQHTHSLTHLGLYHRQYERLMDHWKQVLPLPILDVSYEDVIAEPEAQSRRLIDFSGLPWNDACLNFHKTKRSVATASMHQVRKPIYKSSVQRWRHYEKYLAPLKTALGIA